MTLEWEGKNLLCFGDNLGFLSDHQLFPDACIDLIYLDPPFNSQQSYNVLFKEASGTPEAAQFKAFEDTWRWDTAANAALAQIHTDSAVPGTLVDLMKTFMNFMKPSPMMAYLVQMAIRLVHMHRILKPTGSLYLHCDPTASHYLKLVLDAIFGPRNFANEIVWKRTSAHSDAKQGRKGFGNVTDTLLYYTAGDVSAFNPQHQPYGEVYLRKYRYRDENGRLYRLDNLTGPGGAAKGNPSYEVMGIVRHWRYSKEKMQQLIAEGRVVQTKPGTVPQYKRYLDEMPGAPVQNLWDDISPINSQAQERLGYPTQKPLELLKRIVAFSSNPGDVVMDPFCGCGTTIDAVETLNRESGACGTAAPGRAEGDKAQTQPRAAGLQPRTWIGIDITHLAINLIKHRLTRFTPVPQYLEMGAPESVAAGESLAQRDRHQFELWALGLIGARPAGARKQKGADKGIDGVRYFQDEQKNGAWVAKKMLVQVKSGHVTSAYIRDLAGAMTRERAEMGVFLTLEPPSKDMRSEAAAAGTYLSPWDSQPYPKIQILTIEELLKDPHRPNPRCLQVPGGSAQHTLPEPPKHRLRKAKHPKLDFDQSP